MQNPQNKETQNHGDDKEETYIVTSSMIVNENEPFSSIYILIHEANYPMKVQFPSVSFFKPFAI